MGEAVKKIWMAVFLAAVFLAANGYGQETGERQDLLRKQKELSEKIESLKREEDFLLFRKTFYESDSKYLILNVAAGTGQLRYKNRVLKGFTLSVPSGPGDASVRGMITLTKKEERPGGKFALIFGKSLVIRSKFGRVLPQDAHIARFYLSRKDLAAVFYALEEGAKAYVLR